MSKTLANEAGTVQFPLVKHAAEIGWTVISDAEALRRRGGEAGLFFDKELEDALLRLNPDIITPDSRPRYLSHRLVQLPLNTSPVVEWGISKLRNSPSFPSSKYIPPFPVFHT